MIKPIRRDQLTVGMYVHDLNCSWMEHGFLQSRLLIRTAADLERVRALDVEELFIDTDKGTDVPEQSAMTPQAGDPAQAKTRLPAPASTKPVKLADERTNAKRIHQEAVGVVRDLMDDVRLGRQVDLARADPVITGMVDSIFRNQDALLGLTRIRHMDRYTFEHSVNVSVLMVSFARSLEFERSVIHDIGLGALLHDIGKILVPSEILNKPGRLTDQEFVVMRGHVVHSRDILARAPNIPEASLAVAAEHHERMDGSGYPEGKAGPEISIYGQMASIVDVYDAITADRVYHKGMPPHQALGKLMEWSGHHFDPQLVQKFVRCLGIYPIGTVVRLSSGRLGVVMESSRSGLFSPVVRVFMDAKQRRYLPVEDVDLSRLAKGTEDRVLGVESPQAWGIDPAELLARPI